MVFKLARELLNNDYDTAKLYLEQHNYNYDQVAEMVQKQIE